MKAPSLAGQAAGVLWGIVLFTAQQGTLFAQTVTTPRIAADEVIIDGVERTVEVLPAGATQWQPALKGRVLKPGDRVRTREFSQVTLLWSEKSVTRLAELSDVQIQAPPAAKQPTSFALLQGVLYFFHRDRLTNARYGTRTASAAIRGTEFVLQAEENGRTTLTVIEGEVDLSNEAGLLTLRTGQQGIAEPGQPPRLTPAIIINNVIQWALYYPAVLDVDELVFTLAERERLRETLAAYKSGDLLRALELLPAAALGASASERIYRAGLLLSVGGVEQAQQVLDTVGQAAGAVEAPARALRLADAVRQLIAAVKLQEWKQAATPQLASEWLAASYSHQARGDLRNAIFAAKKSVDISASFGFGWTRVAELEFSFGHTHQALDALERALQYSPRNAQALALKGFVLAAQNRISDAIYSFNQAMDIDPGLANARLGRGLCLIRQNHAERGREELLIAATLEPQRAILRSYLAKAYTDAGDEKRAEHEIELAKDLDPNDPTAWLYSALLKEQENRINEAIRDLEKSQELTGNRRIYRSGLLLDQDRAVRSANLARIYQDAGMFDVAVREAGRAVNYDYANYSAHLFLADSYNSLRDPKRINLRYETPAESEYLIANLLAPVGGGILSPTISQQEYSKLFERDRLGVVSTTEYSSNGDWVQQGAQFGTYRNSSYAVEAIYRSDNGQRPNNELEFREINLHLKQQITPADSIYLKAITVYGERGDVNQYPDQAFANPGLRVKEVQEPTLALGYHHEWGPNMHTLILGTRLSERFSVMNPDQFTLFIIKEDMVTPSFVRPLTIRENRRTVLEIYGAELQQIWHQEDHTIIAGGRVQAGEFEVENLQTEPSAGDVIGFFPDPAADQRVDPEFERWSAYGYYHWQPVKALRLVAGLSYDLITFPENFRAPPVSEKTETVERVSPKAGLIWQPFKNTVARFAYTRSLAGASFDQSFHLEPSQIAGINQSFRSIIPESIGSAQAGARFETYGLSLEQKLFRHTYVGVFGEILKSTVRQGFGVFEFTNVFDPSIIFAAPGITPNRINYEEKSLAITINQLVGNELSFGARYRLSKADFDYDFVDIPDSAFIDGFFLPREELSAVLHQLNLYGIYNHPSGLFSQVQALWYSQDNTRSGPEALPDDDFWQFNLFVGYRFPGRHAEITLGVVNLTDQNYQLNPITFYHELPRERMLVARLNLRF